MFGKPALEQAMGLWQERLWKHRIISRPLCFTYFGVLSPENVTAKTAHFCYRNFLYRRWICKGTRKENNCIWREYYCLGGRTFPTHGADKSLALPGRKQARKNVRDASDFNNIETRALIKFFPPARQGDEGNSRRSDRNISLFPSWSS